ncbi:MAG: hypothetical protein H9847_09910 [Candidatus Anaerobiospirillum pullicola]|uniref:Lipoprotein NlpI n=1 Tax=Candidatus Anaerobiospirillum pullicola TaxID=2838451 RepID=A0A948X263_9GAMM|nr:hypothetical protein [Candidatus Anaerobiospirillum pullicola]
MARNTSAFALMERLFSSQDRAQSWSQLPDLSPEASEHASAASALLPLKPRLSLMLRRCGFACGVMAFALGLNACSVNTSSNVFDPPLDSTFSVDKRDVILTGPNAEEREQYQLMVAQLTHMLGTEKLSAERRAQVLYQLGLLYDRLGMNVTARTMLMSALIAVPDYAQVYNFLGIYLASAERFAEAYDAYDAALELDPEENYAYFNRGIALYYGKRPQLALDDLKKFYEFDHNDPFRIAWLYIVERTVEGQEVALEHLAQRRAAIEKEVPWGLEVLDFYLGKIDSHELIDAIRNAEIPPEEVAPRLCEAYFYMAKQAEFDGKYKLAYDLFHLCVTTDYSGYLEYRYALLEIARYERQEIIAAADEIADAQQQERDAFLRQQAAEAQKYFEKLQEQHTPLKQEQAAPVVPPIVNPESLEDQEPQLVPDKVDSKVRTSDSSRTQDKVQP